MNKACRIAFVTIVRKECIRFLRIWTQTILPSMITLTLYFIVFGHLIGPRIGPMSGFSYMQFIAPGLIMMAIITNSYANVVSAFFSVRFQKSIEEMLVSPMPHYVLLLGYIIAGVARGLVVALGVTLVTLFFTHLTIYNYWITISIVVLTALFFSLAGFTNAIFARKFDDVAIVPTFILTPLTFLGGVFYSIALLPPLWKNVALANPILYIVDAFRYGILGISDIPIYIAFIMVSGFIVLLFWLNLYLLHKGVGIRS